jgi:hypothetical protein
MGGLGPKLLASGHHTEFSASTTVLLAGSVLLSERSKVSLLVSVMMMMMMVMMMVMMMMMMMMMMMTILTTPFLTVATEIQLSELQPLEHAGLLQPARVAQCLEWLYPLITLRTIFIYRIYY